MPIETSKKPTIAVIVPTFNRRTLFEASVESVLKQTYTPDFFLILNNASTDGTREYLDTVCQQNTPHKKPEIHVYHEPQNLGASFGMKFLFEKALALNVDWIWVMDDDAYALPDALESLVRTPEFLNPETAILESTIIDENGNWPPANRPALFDPARGFEFQGLPETALESSQGNAIRVNTGGYCGLLIRSQTFAEFGFPHAEFYLWHDDSEFVLRVSLQKKVFLIPGSRIRHFAQALVPHRTVWPFSGPLPVIPEKLLWRYYYGTRNLLWMAKQWIPARKYARFWGKHMVRGLVAPLLFQQDRVLYRWHLTLKAGTDALLNRLGKRVEPRR